MVALVALVIVSMAVGAFAGATIVCLAMMPKDKDKVEPIEHEPVITEVFYGKNTKDNVTYMGDYRGR